MISHLSLSAIFSKEIAEPLITYKENLEKKTPSLISKVEKVFNASKPRSEIEKSIQHFFLEEGLLLGFLTEKEKIISKEITQANLETLQELSTQCFDELLGKVQQKNLPLQEIYLSNAYKTLLLKTHEALLPALKIIARSPHQRFDPNILVSISRISSLTIPFLIILKKANAMAWSRFFSLFSNMNEEKQAFLALKIIARREESIQEIVKAPSLTQVFCTVKTAGRFHLN